jgi:hypothetical protein
VGSPENRPVPPQNSSHEYLSWVFMTRLGSLVVLADHVAEYLPRSAERRSGFPGRALLAGLGGPVPVVMAGVLAEACGLETEAPIRASDQSDRAVRFLPCLLAPRQPQPRGDPRDRKEHEPRTHER